MARLPKLLTAKQFAAHLGKPHRTIMRWLKDDMIPDAQVVGIQWVIPINAKIRVKGTAIDLPPEFLFEVKSEEMPEYKFPTGNPSPKGQKKVELPGFATVVESRGLTRRRVQAMTGVHHKTQKSALDGHKVTVKVAWKLARGLDVSIEELLRKPWA